MSAIKFQDEAACNQDSDPAKELQVHYLPFKVDHDGEVENVTARFSNQIFHDKDSNVAQNYFRGRSIQGDSIELKGYEGLSVMEEKMPINSMLVDDGTNGKEAGKEKTLTITSKFGKLTYWNWDLLPTAMDAPVKLQDWLELAQILHEPSGMDAEDLVQA